jgi:hypothetical protein
LKSECEKASIAEEVDVLFLFHRFFEFRVIGEGIISIVLGEQNAEVSVGRGG